MPSKISRSIEDEAQYAGQLIGSIIERFPTRRATSAQERKAQEFMEKEFQSFGLETRTESFRYSDHLYANLALHFGVAVAGTLAMPSYPWLALVLHLLALVSYVLDSTHKAFLLRRLFPWGESSNVLATLPAKGEPRLRIVMPAHIDAAFTGFLFRPEVIRSSAKGLLGIGFLRKQLALVCLAVLGLAILDIVYLTAGWWSGWLAWALTLPALIATSLNLQVVARNEIVPGANDDLSGVAALPLLAARLAPWKPEDVELVFVTTGAEEASLGGSCALAKAHLQDWDPKRTLILALDGMSNGELQFFEEGEVIPIAMPPRLRKWLEDTANSEPRFEEVKAFAIPVGGSDAQPFLWHGYHSVCLGCVDLELGSPRHYHHPSDTVENLDLDKIVFCVDFAEKLIHTIEQEWQP